MSDTAVAWTSIVLVGAGTFAIRAAFPLFAHRFAQVPAPVARVLRMIPPAALAALCVPAFVSPDGTVDLTQPRLVAGVVAGVVGFATRNIVATLLVGMGVLLVLDWPF